MTYCVGIKVNEGMVFASDRRTNAGLDNFNSYSKMYVHKGFDRNIIILTSGNLATSQAVFNTIGKELEDDKNVLCRIEGKDSNDWKLLMPRMLLFIYFIQKKEIFMI